MDWSGIFSVVIYALGQLCLSPWILVAILPAAVLYVWQRKWLWSAPLLSTCLFLLIAVWRDGMGAFDNGEWQALMPWLLAAQLILGTAVTEALVLVGKICGKRR